ncbi:NUDIX domain-containing protein [Henriciella litoralis]|uniref:NUDIX domain-containing protein n=1 Tax=Henriciella litoralis TaxID=568102 RepID=UPI001F1C9AFA|nr:NUDIX domain-containing protein [Henriciella litoralis]
MSAKPLKDRVDIIETSTLSDNWTALSKVSFNYERLDGRRERQDREVYERANAIAVLPHDPARSTVLLVRQLRLPAFLNGDDAPLIEACAGIIEDEPPEDCAHREAIEELGYKLPVLKPAFRAYTIPGSVMECVYAFTAEYAPSDRISAGGGVHDEGEEIEVLEMKLSEALAMIKSGEIIDAKTIALLYHLALEGQ